MADAGETGVTDHAGEKFGLWKIADRFHKIAIRFGVAGDRASDLRDHIERVKLVELLKARYIDRGKFQTQKMPARLEHAVGFLQRCIDAGDIANAERDRIGVE